MVELTFPDGLSKGHKEELLVFLEGWGLEAFHPGGLVFGFGKLAPPVPVGTVKFGHSVGDRRRMEKALEMAALGGWTSLQEPSCGGRERSERSQGGTLGQRGRDQRILKGHLP